MKHTYIAFAFICFFSLSAHASEDCNHILSNRIESAIQNLAELRKDLDLKVAGGESGMIVRALNESFKLKQKEIIAIGVSAQDLDQRLKDEILRSPSYPAESLSKVNQIQAAKTLGSEHRMGPIIPIAMKRFHHATILLNDGKVMFAGGVTKNSTYPWSYSREISVLDPETNQIEVWSSQSTERKSPMHQVLSDGRVLVWGGTNLEGSLTLVEMIDPVLKTVTPVDIEFESDSLKTTNTGIFIQDKLLLDQVDGSVLLWDPATGQKQKFIVHPRISHFAMSKLDDESIIASGGSDGGSISYSVFKFHFPTSTLTLLGDLNKGSTSHSQVSTAKGRILTFGGSLTGKTHTDIQSFNLATKKARVVGHLSEQRFRAFVVPVSEDRVLIVGGERLYNLRTSYIGSVELLDMKKGTAEVLGYIDANLKVVSAMLLPDQSALVILERENEAGLSMQKIWVGKR